MDYYMDRQELLYEMAEDFRIEQESQEEDDQDDWFSHPSLTAAERNPNLR